MDPLNAVGSTIAIVQAISSIYDTIKYLKGLPNEFNEVSQSLPLAQDTLELARHQLEGRVLDESSIQAIQPVISTCEVKAQMLRNILEKVEKCAKNAKNGSVLDFYRAPLLRLGKAHRVETLMHGILRCLHSLATNQLFRTPNPIQIVQLQKAVDRLSTVQSSVPDSDFDGSHMTQNIASGGTGYQSANSGQGQTINSGGGNQYNATNMHFGTA
jgi:hypothetical protein